MIGGRRLARRTIVHWLEPLTRQTVLDAGCGAGGLAAHLAGLGAKVVGIDLLPRFRSAPARQGTALRDRGRPRAGGARGSVHHRDSAGGARGLSARGAGRIWCGRSPTWGARRLILVTRVQSSWGDWADRLSAKGGRAPVDTVTLFRGIHLETPYFLTRRETVKRRNHAAEVAEFTLVA